MIPSKVQQKSITAAEAGLYQIRCSTKYHRTSKYNRRVLSSITKYHSRARVVSNKMQLKVPQSIKSIVAVSQSISAEGFIKSITAQQHGRVSQSITAESQQRSRVVSNQMQQTPASSPGVPKLITLYKHDDEGYES